MKIFLTFSEPSPTARSPAKTPEKAPSPAAAGLKRACTIPTEEATMAETVAEAPRIVEMDIDVRD